MDSFSQFSPQLQSFSSIFHLLQFWEKRAPDAIAIEAPERMPLSYGRLNAAVCKIAGALESTGIGRGDRIGIVLPNGPDMAVAFLATAVTATAAPLNHGYSKSELEFYLSDVNAKGVITQEGIDGVARAAAEKLDIPVICLRSEAKMRRQEVIHCLTQSWHYSPNHRACL